MSKHAASQLGLPVDGVERPTREGWTFPARNPADGETLWHVPDAGVPDAHAAIGAARRACYETTWGADTALRAASLRQLQEALVARSDELALLMAAETGVPVALRAAHLDAPIAGMASGLPGAPAGAAGRAGWRGGSPAPTASSRAAAPPPTPPPGRASWGPPPAGGAPASA